MAKKKEKIKELKPLIKSEDFILRKIEYGYIANIANHPYQHKDAGYNIQPGQVVRVKKSDVIWLKNIIGLREVELGLNLKV